MLSIKTTTIHSTREQLPIDLYVCVCGLKEKKIHSQIIRIFITHSWSHLEEELIE